jgi:predicted outer membrane repeat protein
LAAAAETIHVPGDQPTIRAAIQQAADGDTVLIACGTYSEGGGGYSVNSSITLIAESPGCVTINRGTSEGFVVANVDFAMIGIRVHGAWNGISAVNTDLTIIECAFQDCEAHSKSPHGGGAVYCEGGTAHIASTDFAYNFSHTEMDGGGSIMVRNCPITVLSCSFYGDVSVGSGGSLRAESSPIHVENCDFAECWTHPNATRAGAVFLTDCAAPSTFTSCTFRDNQAEIAGGGVALRAASAVFENCRFSGNAVDYYGGGLDVDGASAEVLNCEFVSNVALFGGGMAVRNGLAALDGCVFIQNGSPYSGGGLYASESDTSIRGCTFALNHGSVRAALTFAAGSARVERTIVAFGVGAGGAVRCVDGVNPVLECVDIYGMEGGDWTGCIAGQLGTNGNFSADPLFCNLEGGDCTLHAASPCLPGNHPDGVDCGLIGALGPGCGAVGVEQETWARIKARYSR